MSSSRRSEDGEEWIFGGFSEDSSDSELSETWSELGTRIFADKGQEDNPDGQYEHQEPEEFFDIKIDPFIGIDKDNSTFTSDSNDLSCPGSKISSIPPNFINQSFIKCKLCPVTRPIYFCDEDTLTNHLDQKHKNKNKTTTTLKSTPSVPQDVSQISPQGFTCTICERRFISLEFSKIHYQYHLESLKCIDFNCKMICHDLEDLKRHTSICLLALRCKKDIKARHRLSPLNCIFPECSRGFFDNKDFLRHLKSYHGETPVSLSKQFPENIDQIIEWVAKGGGILISDDDDEYRAQMKKRGNRERKRRQMALETEEKRAARLSRKRIQYRKNLDAYIDPQIRKICEFCGKIFSNNHWLEKHIQIHNNGQPKPKVYLCDICGSVFSCKSSYKIHKERHSMLLEIRKKAHEKKVREENPSKNDKEIAEILEKFWGSEESFGFVTRQETFEEKKELVRHDHIQRIIRNGLQKCGETVEECLVRISEEKKEKVKKKREAETEEERLKRRGRYVKNLQNYREKNKEKFQEYQRKFSRKKKVKAPEARAKYLAYNRDKWAKMTAEQKARRLEAMKNYQKRRKNNSHNNDDDN